ncbi:MAG: sulfatase-like hydrolase/transferase, partial [Acidobacteriota bacterium]|nr:sulfatase-like hydrolase/transferase [Acidobacteriota bacterium]
GYATHAITGGGFVMSVFGFRKGFDEYSMNEPDLADPKLAEHGGREAADWIKQMSDRPFFLFLHTYQVHAPYKSREDLQNLFLGPNPRWRYFDVNRDLGGRRGLFTPLPPTDRDNVVGLYDAGVRTTDEGLIKPVLEALRSQGLYDRTMIILTADHGEGFYEHRAWDHTHSVYEELLRVPLIIKMPGGADAGRRLDPVVRLTDLMPTILDVTGTAYDPAAIDGRSLLPILAGKETADRFVQAELAENINSVHIPQRLAIVDGGFKLTLNQAYSEVDFRFFSPPPFVPPPFELFDLRADPGERKNLAGDPARTALIRGLIRKAEEIAKLIPKPSQSGAAVDPELDRQLRTLGYIR